MTESNRRPSMESVAEREYRYWEFIRKWTWLFALGLTLVGTALVAPAVDRPQRLLVLTPFAYGIFFATLQLAARHGKAALPAVAVPSGFPPDRIESEASQVADLKVALLEQRARIFAFGMLLIAVVLVAWAVLQMMGLTGHLQSSIIMWALVAFFSVGSIAMWIAAGPNRPSSGRTDGAANAPASVLRRIARSSRTSVGRSTSALVLGAVFALLSGQGWRILPFAILSIGSLVAMWLRLGGLIRSLSNDSM